MENEALIKKIEQLTALKDEVIGELNVDGMDWLEKCDLIEAIQDFISVMDIKKFLADLCYDKNYVVRCSAYEALGEFGTKDIANLLIGFIKKEKSKVAKGYLITAIGDIIGESGVEEEWRSVLTKSYKKETSIRVLIQYWCIFYNYTGEREYLYKILEQLNNPNYHIRCTVINSMPRVCDGEMMDRVKECYLKRLEVEESVAVREGIKQVLVDIDKQGFLQQHNGI